MRFNMLAGFGFSHWAENSVKIQNYFRKKKFQRLNFVLAATRSFRNRFVREELQ